MLRHLPLGRLLALAGSRLFRPARIAATQPGARLPWLGLLGLILAGLAVPATADAASVDSPSAAPLELLMVEQPGCAYCARWHEEIGPHYPLTDEGRRAPLRSQQLRAPVPDDIHLAAPPVFTPTFILLAGGREVGRLEGYPGEDFFWPLIAALIARADAR